MDITSGVGRFRKAATHLWNEHFHRDIRETSHENFVQIARILFREIVLDLVKEPIAVIEIDTTHALHLNYCIRESELTELRLFLNETRPAGAGWRFRDPQIVSSNDVTIHPLSFFDFDTDGHRQLEYLLVEIRSCRQDPSIEGFRALVECERCSIHLACSENSQINKS